VIAITFDRPCTSVLALHCDFVPRPSLLEGDPDWLGLLFVCEIGNG
jgi:hypothetical protein